MSPGDRFGPTPPIRVRWLSLAVSHSTSGCQTSAGSPCVTAASAPRRGANRRRIRRKRPC